MSELSQMNQQEYAELRLRGARLAGHTSDIEKYSKILKQSRTGAPAEIQDVEGFFMKAGHSLSMTDEIQPNDIVRIKGRSTRRLVYQVNEKSALLSWGQCDACWWPLDELEKLPQGDLFGDTFATPAEVNALWTETAWETK